MVSSFYEPSDAMSRHQQQQERYLAQQSERKLSAAVVARKRKIHAFKRDYFLAVARGEIASLSVADANAIAEEIIAILYPAVTRETADDYLETA